MEPHGAQWSPVWGYGTPIHSWGCKWTPMDPNGPQCTSVQGCGDPHPPLGVQMEPNGAQWTPMWGCGDPHPPLGVQIDPNGPEMNPNVPQWTPMQGYGTPIHPWGWKWTPMEPNVGVWDPHPLLGAQTDPNGPQCGDVGTPIHLWGCKWSPMEPNVPQWAPMDPNAGVWDPHPLLGAQMEPNGAQCGGVGTPIHSWGRKWTPMEPNVPQCGGMGPPSTPGGANGPQWTQMWGYGDPHPLQGAQMDPNGAQCGGVGPPSIPGGSNGPQWTPNEPQCAPMGPIVELQGPPSTSWGHKWTPKWGAGTPPVSFGDSGPLPIIPNPWSSPRSPL